MDGQRLLMNDRKEKTLDEPSYVLDFNLSEEERRLRGGLASEPDEPAHYICCIRRAGRADWVFRFGERSLDMAEQTLRRLNSSQSVTA